MTNNEIENQINNELEKFKEIVYDGTIKVPENIVDLFKKGIVYLAPQFHKLNFSRVKQLVVKNPNELTVGDITDVARIILNTPFDILYNGLELQKGIDLHIKLEKFMISYNIYIDEFQAKLKMKRATLSSLANTNHNSMRVIN